MLILLWYICIFIDTENVIINALLPNAKLTNIFELIQVSYLYLNLYILIKRCEIFLFRYWECKFYALIERLCFWFCKYFHTISPLPPPVSDLGMFATIYHVHLSRRNTYHAKCDMFYNTAASNPYLMHFHICNLPKFDRSLYFLTGIQYFRWVYKYIEILLLLLKVYVSKIKIWNIILWWMLKNFRFNSFS